MSRRFLPIAILVVWAAGPSSAQWLKHPDPRVPRTVNGKPNLTAPAPHLADGRPDFSGLWNAVDWLDDGGHPLSAEIIENICENQRDQQRLKGIRP